MPVGDEVAIDFCSLLVYTLLYKKYKSIYTAYRLYMTPY